MSEKRLDTTYRMFHEKDVEAKKAATVDMTKTHFQVLDVVRVGEREHTLWGAKVHNGANGHEVFVACIGHKPEAPEYTRGFHQRAEAFDFFNKFKGA